MTKTYDPLCYELAAAFLADQPAIDNEQSRHSLAIEIQNLVEEEMLFMRDQKDANHDQS